MTPRLPLTVIGGFLGAGKTTLVNRWLREAEGQRIAVLVNDFGALNIDADLIAGARGDTIALTNGCVCCQIGDDLSRALIQVLESGTRFDAVVMPTLPVIAPLQLMLLISLPSYVIPTVTPYGPTTAARAPGAHPGQDVSPKYW